MKIILENNEYELVENVREGLDLDNLKEKYTDYFEPYDYIVGDWAYGKLRLKGFYDEKNKNVTDINNINNVKKYLGNNCAYNCKFFIIKKCTKIK
jgi:uncharacterized protein YutD